MGPPTKLDRSRDEIAITIEKVGSNCEMVRKELGYDKKVCTPGEMGL